MFYKVIVFLLFTFSSCFAQLTISQEEAQKIGELIWLNECKGTIAGLTSWNKGEDFASLGIGHFIWYPEGKTGPFEERFPNLVSFLDKNGAPPPPWLKDCRGCPWPNREAFHQDFHSTRLEQLREYLAKSTALQAVFMAKRLENALPKILAACPPVKRQALTHQFYRVANAPMGFYALVDYVNFKGEGILSSEQYKGQGWGLLQVLEHMQTLPQNVNPLSAFATSAKDVLSRRVDNSPPDRNEQRWLKGWHNRIDSYVKARSM